MNPYVVAICFAIVIYVLGVALALTMIHASLVTASKDGGDPFDVYPEEE